MLCALVTQNGRMSNELKKMGKAIRERRLSLKMSQEDLSASAEIDRSYLSEVENGKKNVSFTSLHKICKALDIKASQLLKLLGL